MFLSFVFWLVMFLLFLFSAAIVGISMAYFYHMIVDRLGLEIGGVDVSEDTAVFVKIQAV